jgi:hypothetical protein
VGRLKRNSQKENIWAIKKPLAGLLKSKKVKPSKTIHLVSEVDSAEPPASVVGPLVSAASVSLPLASVDWLAASLPSLVALFGVASCDSPRKLFFTY